MACPFLREVVMAYCSAYPVRKMVPKDCMTEQCACTCDGFAACGLFAEVMTRLRAPAGGEGEASQPDAASKEDLR